MNRVIHFEMHSNDPETSLAFFAGVFGWRTAPWEGAEYWVVTTGADQPGIDGGLLRSRDGNPRTVNTVQVDSVDACLRRVVESGGTVVVPKMPIPGIGYLAYCNDPTGVLFGIMHEDPAAGQTVPGA